LHSSGQNINAAIAIGAVGDLVSLRLDPLLTVAATGVRFPSARRG
jgi:hypothetical protein